jgi:hypothetical protein
MKNEKPGCTPKQKEAVRKAVELDAQLEQKAADMGLTKVELIRRAISQFAIPWECTASRNTSNEP